MSDIRQAKEYASYLQSINWIVENESGVNYFIKKLPILGYFIKIQRPKTIDFKTINQLEVKYRPFQIVIEPDLFIKGGSSSKRFIKEGFKLSKISYLPTKTLQLDLTKTEDKLYKGFKKDCRYALAKAKNERLIFNPPINKFHKYWRACNGFRRYTPPHHHLKELKQSFGKNIIFIMGKSGEAGAIFLLGGKTGYYWQAFTGRAGRKSLVQYKIVWEGIRWTKERGSKVFDFEGIYDERFPNKSWLGFTHFKKSFSGKEVKYPEAFVRNIYFNLLKY